MAMRLLVGRTRRHIPQEWSQTDQEDRQPTASYLWMWSGRSGDRCGAVARAAGAMKGGLRG
jgi:hypothetical protein